MNIKDKLQAFIAHLSISIIISILCLSLVYLVWNPSPLYKATGITDIFILMLSIDIILGPLLTFIVYKKGKKTLKFDLIVIALLQLSALTYGLYNVYEGRPVWITYIVDRFELIRNHEVDNRKLKESNLYKTSSITGPKYVVAIIPEDPKRKSDIFLEEAIAGISPAQRPELYQSIENAYPLIRKKALDLKKLNSFNDSNKVKDIVKKYPDADSYVPLKASALDMTVLINRKTGHIIAIVDLRPWE